MDMQAVEGYWPSSWNNPKDEGKRQNTTFDYGRSLNSLLDTILGWKDTEFIGWGCVIYIILQSNKQ